MLLTLNANSLRLLLKPKRGKPKLGLLDLPAFATEQFGLHGLTIPTDMLVGATRQVLEGLRDRGDKAGCACLLLSETEAQKIAAPSEKIGSAAAERIRKVVEASSLLGCNACSVPLDIADTDAALELAATRLRPVLDRAERLEINVLISPMKGLTASPERATELVKKAGGFRIGTLPDLQTAAESDDGPSYLKRLTPYAAVINASTFEFAEPEPAPKSEREPKPDQQPGHETPGPSDGASRLAADLGLDLAALGGTDPAGADAGATPPDASDQTPAGDPPDETAAALDIDPDDPMGALAAMLEQEIEDFEDAAPPVHLAYDLGPLMAAIHAVGFDGTVAIDYRGPAKDRDDAILGVLHSREALEAALAAAAEK
ncbi:MAG: hypothetical protein AAF995_05590 [Planctomycetota bacterium]